MISNLFRLIPFPAAIKMPVIAPELSGVRYEYRFKEWRR